MGYLREPLPTAIVFSTLITPLNDSHVCHVPDSFLEHVVVCVARWELKGNAYDRYRHAQITPLQCFQVVGGNQVWLHHGFPGYLLQL